MQRERNPKLKTKLTKSTILNYNLMIHDKRLEGKHVIEPEIAIEMIQLIAGFKAFHSTISKMIIGVQEANSFYSIDEISLPTTPSIGKRV